MRRRPPYGARFPARAGGVGRPKLSGDSRIQMEYKLGATNRLNRICGRPHSSIVISTYAPQSPIFGPGTIVFAIAADVQTVYLVISEAAEMEIGERGVAAAHQISAALNRRMSGA